MTDPSTPAEIAADALRLIDRYGCEKLTRGRCSDPNSGYDRGYGWCDACIASDALQRMEVGIGPAPSWQAILTAERDEARDRADRVVSVGQHMADSWERLRRGAEDVLAIRQETVDTVGRLSQ